MRRLAPLLLLAIIVACGDGRPKNIKAPPGILPKDSMAYFLSQVHMIDAATRHREVRKHNLQVYAKQGFLVYFDTAKVSRERFLASLEFWGDDFDQMSEIYDLAMERLSTQMAKLKSEEKKAKK